MRVLNCGASGKATLYGAGLGEECGISMTRLAMWNWAYVIHCAVLWWEKGDEMKNIGLAAVAILASLAVSSCSRQQPKDAADIVIRNARVYTVDKDRPSAQAVAVRGNRIVWVGSNQDSENYVATTTRVIDAGGRMMLPGYSKTGSRFFGSAP